MDHAYSRLETGVKSLCHRICGAVPAMSFPPIYTLYLTDSNMRSAQLIRTLVIEQFGLPLNDVHSYMLITEQGTIIAEEQTLAEAGVGLNDRIHLSVSRRSAGGWPELLTIVASLASVAQVVLMVIDMWSRKAKERSTGKTRTDERTAWNEVKSIRILM